MQIQYINDNQGKPLYAIVPIEEFERLTADREEYWADIPCQSDEFDDVPLPDAVVGIMAERDVSVMAAWRIHRGMTQAQAAEKAGITQAALSQTENSGRPHAKTREQFAEIYNCQPEQLAL